MADAMMMFLGEAHGVNWYWAQPGEFENPGVYYWDGAKNVLCVPHLSAPEAPAQGVGCQQVDYCKANGCLDAAMRPHTKAQAIPAPWREAVKAMREALREALCEPDRNLEQRPGRRDVIRAAIALADALEGGE